ncbi:diguanylate cyclase [Sphingomonas sp.]|uniref:GGDEF domain-containing protein n=1 Tax=Sphingomonas sp. TaxID=28214 RepID=UPI003B3BCD11
MSIFSLLIAVGPCLLMAMAAIAQLLVHAYLSRARHGLFWAAAFAAGAMQWAIMTGQGIFAGRPLHGGVIADLFGMASPLLFAEGFRRRADLHAPWVLPAIAMIGATLLIATAPPPRVAIRAAINPLLAATALGWAATMVRRRDGHDFTIEAAMTGVLGAIVSVHLIAASLAGAEQIGWLAGHRAYVLLYAVTVAPACAAIALFTLLLTAHDFSVELRRLVHTDPLTGVLNRLGFDDAIRRLQRRGRRPLAIAVADIDHFKHINDTYGHAAGDAVLARFAGQVSDGLRPEDCVARVGGEEFAMLLPGMDGPAAHERIDSLRERMRDLAIDGHPGLAVRASFGVADWRPDESIEAMLERADHALYLSKRAGRDRTTQAPDSA